jgi:hypothetical protein
MVHNKHALDIADTLCDHDLNSLTSRKPIPAIIYPMGKEFIGTNLESREGIYEENIVLRTNYPYVIKKQNELFSNKDGERTIIYSNPITIIRDSNYNPLDYSKLYKVAILTLTYERKKELLVEKIKDSKHKKSENNGKHKEDDAKENYVLSSDDILTFQILLENAFQAAICGSHDVMILSLFGQDFGIPVDDQIKIFNICILKFGHYFKGIMVCIPLYEGKELFDYFDRNIIKPHIMVKEIDMKYQSEMMLQKLNNNVDEDADKDEDDKNDNKKVNLAELDEDEQLKVLKKMIKNKSKSKGRK